MKILIATGIYPPDIGGPAKYAKNLEDEWKKNGFKVEVAFFNLENKLPTGLRHLYYFFRLLPKLWGVNFILILDTFSVGLPTVLAAKILCKKTILRIGGDFLWEQYVKNHQEDIILRNFYTQDLQLSFKEKTIFILTKFILQKVNCLVFSTIWQKDIFIKEYQLNEKKCKVIENFYPAKLKYDFNFEKKNFLWAGREIRLKNTERLKEAFLKAKKERPDIFLDLISGISTAELSEKIKNSYALIFPSLSEISPNFILEGIRYSKPFILTKENGLINRIGDFGLFVNPLDIEDIKNKILFLADSVNYRRVQAKVSQFNFSHSWTEIAKEFENLYKNL